MGKALRPVEQVLYRLPSIGLGGRPPRIWHGFLNIPEGA